MQKRNERIKCLNSLNGTNRCFHDPRGNYVPHLSLSKVQPSVSVFWGTVTCLNSIIKRCIEVFTHRVSFFCSSRNRSLSANFLVTKKMSVCIFVCVRDIHFDCAGQPLSEFHAPQHGNMWLVPRGGQGTSRVNVDVSIKSNFPLGPNFCRVLTALRLLTTPRSGEFSQHWTFRAAIRVRAAFALPLAFNFSEPLPVLIPCLVLAARSERPWQQGHDRLVIVGSMAQ